MTPTRKRPWWCRTVVTLVIVLFFPGVPSATARAQAAGQGQAESLLQTGRNKEVVEGNLAEAIKIYQQVVARYSGNRSVAARASLYTAQCYEKLGASQTETARRAYQDIVSAYADQPEVVGQAKARLAALGQVISGADIRARRIAEDLSALAVSNDGRQLAYIDPGGDIGVLDVRTGERRLLTHDSANWTQGGAEGGAVFSPDGSLLAFGWYPENGALELRTVATAGSAAASRVVFRCNDEITWFELRGWAPDGATLLATMLIRAGKGGTTIATVSVPGGRLHALKNFSGAWSVGNPRLSPGGRHVVYEWASRAESQLRDVMILSVADSREAVLVQGPASQPTWSTDGRTLVFLSNRRGSADLWRQAIEEGRPQGDPELLRPGVGAVTLLGATASGALFYRSAVNLRYAYTAGLDPSTGAASKPSRADDHVAAPAGVSWSPDQTIFTFFRTDPLRLVLRTTATGAEREIPLAVQRPSLSGWFPDGRSVLISGRDAQGNDRTIRQYLDPARVESIPRIEGLTFHPPLISPDGTAMYAVTLLTEAFTRPAENECAITRVDLASGTAQHVLRTTRGFRSVALARDGNRLAYIVFGTTPDAADELYVTNVAGGQPRRITEFPRPSYAFGGLTWSADGEHLLVVVNPGTKGSQNEVHWISVSDGRNSPTGIAMASVFNGLSLSPDGRQIAFEGGVARVEPWVMENLLAPAASVR